MDFFWKNQHWEFEDRSLEALRRAPFRRSMEQVPLDPGVTLIRGPRQVGKTTWLKLLLKQALTLAAPKECFYLSCEELSDYQDLAELIRSQPEVRYFFLDEITFVREWWRAIKKKVDSDSRVTFVLTGSNSYDLKRGLDLMPGRWSKGPGEWFLFPMLYEEWCAMRRQASWPDLERVEGIRAFMRTGGFPQAVAEGGPNADFPIQARLVYRRWIEGDVIQLARQPQFMRELMGQVAHTLTSSLSLQTLAKRTQMMSYHTAQDYLSVLEHAFALRTLYAYDPDKDLFSFKKEKKFYFTDPIVFQVAREWMRTPILAYTSKDEEQLAEMIAAEWLIRKNPRMGYFKTQAGEIDFVGPDRWAVEVKWSDANPNLSKAFKAFRSSRKTVWHPQRFFEWER